MSPALRVRRFPNRWQALDQTGRWAAIIWGALVLALAAKMAVAPNWKSIYPLYADAARLTAQPDDLRVTAELVDGKVKPLFPRIG